MEQKDQRRGIKTSQATNSEIHNYTLKVMKLDFELSLSGRP